MRAAILPGLPAAYAAMLGVGMFRADFFIWCSFLDCNDVSRVLERPNAFQCQIKKTLKALKAKLYSLVYICITLLIWYKWQKWQWAFLNSQ